jgi:hypothetical protein
MQDVLSRISAVITDSICADAKSRRVIDTFGSPNDPSELKIPQPLPQFLFAFVLEPDTASDDWRPEVTYL